MNERKLSKIKIRIKFCDDRKKKFNRSILSERRRNTQSRSIHKKNDGRERKEEKKHIDIINVV